MNLKAVKAGAFKPAMAAMVMLGLSACVSAPKKDVTPYETAMANVEAQVAVVGPEASIQAFEDVTKTDPTRKEPWVRIAQLQFDQGNYARAIVAAEEVLQRDPEDLVADGVITVAGFRVANQSLQRLEERGALHSETARTEAKALVNTLRSTMGNGLLEAERPKVRRQTRGNTGGTRGGRGKADVAPPAARATRSSSDPFQNIGN